MNADRTPPGYLDFGFVHGVERSSVFEREVTDREQLRNCSLVTELSRSFSRFSAPKDTHPLIVDVMP